MKKVQPSHERLLAVDPTTRGFAYAVFEGPGNLIDWGLCHVGKKKHEGTIERVAGLIQTYEPAVLLLEDALGPGARRGPRARRLLRSLRELAQSFGIRTYAFSKVFVQAAFAAAEAVTKEEIARTVAGRYPELSHRMPPERKIWESEDHRINLFDAVALAEAYYEVQRRRRHGRPAKRRLAA